jgi:hypothetical protein
MVHRFYVLWDAMCGGAGKHLSKWTVYHLKDRQVEPTRNVLWSRWTRD